MPKAIQPGAKKKYRLNTSKLNLKNRNMSDLYEITDQELGDIPRSLYNDWADLMQALWTASIAFYGVIKDERLLPKNGDNEIWLGKRYRLVSHFVNHRFITTTLEYNGKELIDVRYFGDVNPVTLAVFAILKGHFRNAQ
jgi:hypothetical protein